MDSCSIVEKGTSLGQRRSAGLLVEPKEENPLEESPKEE